MELNGFSPNTNRVSRRFKPCQPTKKLDEINLPKEILKTALTKLQAELILELCGSPYQRDTNRQFQRAAVTNRTLKTRHGPIQFKLVVVRNLENNSYFRPLLIYLGV
ncbi:MAG: hypothetical protein LBB87_00465, partial [Nitrososphaerota archaeon]|nr:hypothetical protein [Nitrososphaerota archaeon]